MFLLAFYGFFRVGKLAAKGVDSAASGSQILIHNGQPQMIKIAVTAFKHNTDRTLFEISIDRVDTLSFCPSNIG